jgi:simple sugar transport system ATP-binding protein
MNILFGLLRPTEGEVRVGGRPVRLSNPRVAQRLGIGMVHQHFKLVPTLTVLENLALFIKERRSRLRADAVTMLERLQWVLPLEERVERLTVGQQQRVEILKALMTMETARKRDGQQTTGAGGTLILDEPTAVLTPQESAELFEAVKALKTGGTAVVFISHKLAEIRQVCDEVAILRRGKMVYTGSATGEMSAEGLAEKMVGAKVELPRLERAVGSADTQRVVLAVEGISNGMLKDVSLEVAAGEIVGIAGVDGNGQAELVRAILGMDLHRRTEKVSIDGSDATRRDLAWRVERIACIAEDRQKEALVLPLSIEDNLLLKAYRKKPFSTLGWLRFGQWRREADRLIKAFDVRGGSEKETVGRLSGGNQQKVVLARELSDTGKPVVVAINPTRGLDIGATAFVMRQLLAARERGAGVLLIHSDLDELLAISDRVMVMYGGRLKASRWPAGGKEEIGRLMLGLDAAGEGRAA